MRRIDWRVYNQLSGPVNIFTGQARKELSTEYNARAATL